MDEGLNIDTQIENESNTKASDNKGVAGGMDFGAGTQTVLLSSKFTPYFEGHNS